ncbi:MAG: LysM peptidoglycan-binding domain-containing protein [Deltaproteobacteria bacterium]|jgi:LysM repeat protein|nr:LysM peptidoglycan-binding domain-containing protein [Deltaproteobacteria bacterium]
MFNPLRTGRRRGGRFNPAAALIIAAAVLTVPAGCSGMSEDELGKLKVENAALAVELTSARREADLLNRALTNVYKERDRLVDLLNAPLARPEEQTSADETAAAAPAAPADTERNRSYVVQAGDTLGVIASRHSTTAEAILRLNPQLRSRPQMMVWLGERLLIPR